MTPPTKTTNWYADPAVWVNVLSVIAAGGVVMLQLAGQLQLTAQQVAIATIVLGLVNAAIRVLHTAEPIALPHAVARRLGRS